MQKYDPVEERRKHKFHHGNERLKRDRAKSLGIMYVVVGSGMQYTPKDE